MRPPHNSSSPLNLPQLSHRGTVAPLQVVIGTLSRYNNDPAASHERRGVVAAIKHPQHDSELNNNDIGLLLLDRPSRKTPIKLATYKSARNMPAQASALALLHPQEGLLIQPGQAVCLEPLQWLQTAAASSSRVGPSSQVGPGCRETAAAPCPWHTGRRYRLGRHVQCRCRWKALSRPAATGACLPSHPPTFCTASLPPSCLPLYCLLACLHTHRPALSCLPSLRFRPCRPCQFSPPKPSQSCACHFMFILCFCRPRDELRCTALTVAAICWQDKLAHLIPMQKCR